LNHLNKEETQISTFWFKP